MANPETLFGVDLKAVRDRLATLSYFSSVDDVQGGAEALGGLRPFLPPAGFVSVARESYAPNRLAAGGHSQRATVVLSILFCVPAQRADGGVGDEVEQARKAVLAVLKGWQPPGAGKPLEAVDYRVRLIDKGLVWGEWQFRTAFDLSLVAAP